MAISGTKTMATGINVDPVEPLKPIGNYIFGESINKMENKGNN